jgi:hypothetical protein
MIDGATLKRWIDALDPNANSRVAVQQSPAGWTIEAQRSVHVDAVRAEWLGPGAEGNPAEVVAAVATGVVSPFPLVQAAVTEQGPAFAIQFWAPVFDDGLTQQAFLLTVSAVLKAAETFDTVQAMRRDELSALAEVRAEAERIRQSH